MAQRCISWWPTRRGVSHSDKNGWRPKMRMSTTCHELKKNLFQHWSWQEERSVPHSHEQHPFPVRLKNLNFKCLSLLFSNLQTRAILLQVSFSLSIFSKTVDNKTSGDYRSIDNFDGGKGRTPLKWKGEKTLEIIKTIVYTLKCIDNFKCRIENFNNQSF